MNVKKSANITSNDSSKAMLAISFSGKVVPDTDTVSTVVFGPGLMQFNPDSRKHQVVFENVKDSVSLNIKQVGYLMDDIAIKTPGKAIAPGEEGKIEIEWKGDLPEYDADRSITFETGSSATPRFTVAYSIKGAKGPRPVPPRPAKPATVTSQTSTSRPNTTVKNPTSFRPQPVPVKADSTKKETTPWGSEVWPPK